MIVIILSSCVTALELKDYPYPFVQNNALNSLVVVGEKASSADSIGAANILAKLAQGGICLKKDADSFRIEAGDDHFQSISTISGLVDQVGENQLRVLESGIFNTGRGSTRYKQYISLPGERVRFAIDPDDETDIPNLYLKFTDNSKAYYYTLIFDEPVSSENDANDCLSDFEGRTLVMLGKTVSIIKAEHLAQDSVKLTLMTGAIRDRLEEGQTKTYDIDGKKYDITPILITDTEPFQVKFTINDETTKSLQETQVHNLNDGLEIGISEILANEAGDAGQDMVEFYLSADKIVLKDTNITDLTSSDNLEVDNIEVSGAEIIIEGTDEGISTGNILKIYKIMVNYTAQDDFYAPGGKGLSNVIDDKNAIFLQGFDFIFAGVERGNSDIVKILPDNDNNYKMTFTNINGDDITFDLFGYDNRYILGKKDTTNRDLIVNENTTINEKDYFIIASQDYSYVLEYTNIDKGNDVLEFKDLGTDKKIKVPYDNNAIADNGGIDGYINIDGYTFGVAVQANEQDIRVDLDSDGNVEAYQVITFKTKTGTEIIINDTTNNTFRLYAKERLSSLDGTVFDTDGMDEDRKDGIKAGVYWDSANNELDINTTAIQGVDIAFLQVGDLNMEKGGAYFSTGLTRDWTASQGNLTITNYDEQGFYDLRVVGRGVTILDLMESPCSSTIDIGGELTKLDSELTLDDKELNNIIIIGGPCANSLAAELAAMGRIKNCEEAVAESMPGEAYIDLVENAFADGKHAIVVQGYTSDDTRKAAYLLQNYEAYKEKLNARSIKVKGDSITSPVIG
ncbi:MAG: S-layer protein [Nanoarchaeota archaeon]